MDPVFLLIFEIVHGFDMVGNLNRRDVACQERITGKMPVTRYSTKSKKLSDFAVKLNIVQCQKLTE